MSCTAPPGAGPRTDPARFRLDPNLRLLDTSLTGHGLQSEVPTPGQPGESLGSGLSWEGEAQHNRHCRAHKKNHHHHRRARLGSNVHVTRCFVFVIPAFGRTRQFGLVRFVLLLLLLGIVTPGSSEQELLVQSGETA